MRKSVAPTKLHICLIAIAMMAFFMAAAAHASCWFRKPNQKLDQLGFPQGLCVDAVQLATDSRFDLGTSFTSAVLTPDPQLRATNRYEYVSDEQNYGQNGFVILKQYSSPSMKPYFDAVMTLQVRFINGRISNKNLVIDGVMINENSSPDMRVTPTVGREISYTKLP